MKDAFTILCSQGGMFAIWSVSVNLMRSAHCQYLEIIKVLLQLLLIGIGIAVLRLSRLLSEDCFSAAERIAIQK